ncbi:hypothetical protein H1R20_g12481, partial [Candolleomyces eurysporus]
MSPSLKEISGFSDLPEDVGRVVFELTAELDQETGRSCALVSRKVNAWIEPKLYRTLIIESAKQMENLCRIVENIINGDSTKPPGFFASHVKAIAFANDREELAPSILSILKACHNVERLVLWCMPLESDSEQPSQADRDLRELREFLASPELSPRWISTGNDTFTIGEDYFSYPIFQNATHVDLICECGLDTGRWNTLRHLPFLTHLSVFCDISMKECDRWVRETVGLGPISLRVLIVWLPNYYFDKMNREFEGLKAIHDGNVDSRAVVACMENPLRACGLHPILRSYQDTVRDFAGVSVGKDFWNLAEEFIEERRRRREVQITDTLQASSSST